VLRQTGKAPPGLAEPPIPPAARYLWNWFWSFHRSRPAGEGGPRAILLSEIRAWSEMTGMELREWELEAIWRLDGAVLSQMSIEFQHRRPKDRKK
jgi:hypothetical protein